MYYVTLRYAYQQYDITKNKYNKNKNVTVERGDGGPYKR